MFCNGNIFGLILKNKIAATGVFLSAMQSAYISLTIGPRGLGWKTNLQEIMTAKLKSAYISLIIGPRGLQCETNL